MQPCANRAAGKPVLGLVLGVVPHPNPLPRNTPSWLPAIALRPRQDDGCLLCVDEQACIARSTLRTSSLHPVLPCAGRACLPASSADVPLVYGTAATPAASMVASLAAGALSGQAWCGPPGRISSREALSSIRPWLADTWGGRGRGVQGLRRRWTGSARSSCLQQHTTCKCTDGGVAGARAVCLRARSRGLLRFRV